MAFYKPQARVTCREA